MSLEKRLERLEEDEPDEPDYVGPFYSGISDVEEFQAGIFGEDRRGECEANEAALWAREDAESAAIYREAARLAAQRGVKADPTSAAFRDCIHEAADTIIGDPRQAAGWSWFACRPRDRELIEHQAAPKQPPTEPPPLPNGLHELQKLPDEEDFDDDYA